jgi:hypothetical protein
MIDTANLKTIDIDLANLIKASEIRSTMKENDIRIYCYSFVYKNTIMKFGESHTWKPSTYGERIYRQAWHIPGWPTIAQSRSGDDMLDIIKNFHGIHKSDCWIRIWDMTNYPATVSADPSYDVKDLERQLIKEYCEQNNGERPVGNIKSEEHMDAPIVKDEIFNTLFAWAPVPQ